jgi:hypothetical protein
MEFRLTYQGPLMGASRSSTRASHKHDIRRVFHRQLRRLWETEPYLKTALYSNRYQNPTTGRQLRKDWLAAQYARLGYNFVPLVTQELRLFVGVDILFLRPSMPGEVLKSGDIDNRLKTLFDALRLPDTKEELGGADAPADDEKPFYCLMTDDKLISSVSVQTDMLLEPTGDHGDHDARLVIAVRLKPFDPGWDNISFG